MQKEQNLMVRLKEGICIVFKMMIAIQVMIAWGLLAPLVLLLHE